MKIYRNMHRVLALLMIALPLILPTLPGFAAERRMERPVSRNQVLVRFAPGIDAAQKAAVRERFAATYQKRIPGTEIECWQLPRDHDPEEIADELRRDPALEEVIDHAEPNYLYNSQAVPNDPLYDRLWYLENTGQQVKGATGVVGADISAVEAWEVETGDPNLVIAVIDSGVAFEHPDLANNTWINTDEIPENGVDDDENGYVDDVYGWDFVNNDGNPSDYSRDLAGDGHGTHVAGIIASQGNNGVGTTGVMWRARIMALQVFDLFESSSFQSAIIQSLNIISAVRYAADNGAKIINCSFGGPSFSLFQYEAFQYANERGVLVTAAAGNDDANNDFTPTYPASYDLANIISVAATDEDDRLASYSNFGESTVDVGAPGGNAAFNIYSAIPPRREVIFFEDFEAGDANWEKSANVEEWSRSFDPAFGSFVMRDSEGNYANNENASITTRPPINAQGYRGLHIQFRSSYSLEPNFDFMLVEGSTDGENFSVDFPVTGFITGFSNGITSLLAWGSDEEVGDAFYLRFRLETDNSRTFDGVRIDDITLTGIRWDFLGDEYDFKSGTSMAAPVVAGVAGLVWSHRPELTHIEVKNAILNAVDPIPSLSGMVLSGGRVNAFRALDAVTEPSVPEDTDTGDGGGSTDLDGGGGGGGGCFIDLLENARRFRRPEEERRSGVLLW